MRLSGSFIIGDLVDITKVDSVEVEANQVTIDILSNTTLHSNEFIAYIKQVLSKLKNNNILRLLI